MQRLLATAAAIPLAGCTRADTQGTQTVTIPVVAASSSSARDESTAHGSLLPPPSATATAKPTATAPETGYAVVDPIPAPARCMGLAAVSKATASFQRHNVTRAAYEWLLEITLALPTSGPWAAAAFPPAMTLSPWSGSLVSSNVTGRTAKASVRVPAGATSAGVSFPVACGAGRNGAVAVTVSFSGPPGPSAKVTLVTNDY